MVTSTTVHASPLICDACADSNDPKRFFCRRCGNRLRDTLAVRPAATETHRQASPVTSIVEPPIVETFRLLALNIQRLIGGLDRRSILVLSAWPNHGRSLICRSLARALSEIMPPVLLVDADPAGAGVNGHGMPGSRNGSGHHEELLDR